MRPNLTIALSSLLAIQIVNPLFSAPVTFAARRAIKLNSALLTLADINKDGNADIVATVLNPADGEYQVSIQLGNGHGTFTQGPIVDLGTGVVPTAIATGDFNLDGLLDIAVLSSNDHALYILKQGFTGFTRTPIHIPESTIGTLDIGVADLNGDHFPDLVIPSAEGAVLLLSSGSGQFNRPVLANSVASSFVVVADLNGDKKQDLVLSGGNCCGQSSVNVLLGDGRGVFTAPLSEPPLFSTEPRLAVADFNKDGKLDIAAITESAPGTVLISLGNGDGTFASPSSFSIPSRMDYGLSVVAGDLNGDGSADLVVLATNNYSCTAAIVFLNEGKGTFEPASVYPVQLAANVVALGNLNSDAYPDAVINDNGQGSVVSLLFNNGLGGLVDGEVVPTHNAPLYLVSGDFNGDGKLDLATVDGSDGLTVFLNTGNNRSLFTPETLDFPFYTGPVVAADLNNDGREDIVVLNNGVGKTLVGSADGSFSVEPASFITGSFPETAAVLADMNGDGKLDLVTNAPTVNLGNGDGTFQPALTGAGGDCLADLAPAVGVGDFNMDGIPDVMIECAGNTLVFLGTGDGTLTFNNVSVYQPGFLTFAMGDFNGDGLPDLAFTSIPNPDAPSSGQVTIWPGLGNGYFTDGPTVAVLVGTSGQIVAGDFDGNGVTDLAILDDVDSVVSILRGNGDGTFQLPELFGTSTSPTCILDGRFRSGSVSGEQDLVFCSGQGIGVDLNTTSK